MTRLQRFARGASLLVTLLSATAAASNKDAAPTSTGHLMATIGSVATQLGVKIADRGSEEFGLGVQFTGVLAEPDKLATFGIKGMHVGARVVAARVSPDRVVIEADEMEPAPARGSVRIRLDPDGKLLQPPQA